MFFIKWFFAKKRATVLFLWLVILGKCRNGLYEPQHRMGKYVNKEKKDLVYLEILGGGAFVVHENLHTFKALLFRVKLGTFS